MDLLLSVFGLFFVPLCTPGASSGLLFLLVHPFNVLSHGKIMTKNGRILLGFQSLQVHKTSAFTRFCGSCFMKMHYLTGVLGMTGARVSFLHVAR